MPAHRSKHPFAVAICAAAGLLIATSATLAQEKTLELKLSHWVPPTHPLQKAMEEWGASVEKASNGTIKSKVFPSQQLGLSSARRIFACRPGTRSVLALEA